MKEKEKNENFTKMKRSAKEAAFALRGRLNLGGEAIIAAPASIEERKIDTKSLARTALSFILALILSCGRMAFDTYPLALSLVASATRLAPVMALGASLGSLLFGEREAYIFSYILVLSLRFLFSFWYIKGSDKKLASRVSAAYASAFSESLYMRIALSAPAAFFSGVYTLANRGFYLHDLLGLLFLMVFTPAAVYVFSGAFDPSVRGSNFYSASIAALLFSLVFSLRESTFLGIALSSAAAFFFIMYAAKTRGPIASAFLGLILGFAVSPAHALLLALAGITAGVLIRHSLGAAAIASATVSASLGFFLLGFSSLLALLPSAAVGCTTFSLLYSAGVLPDVARSHAAVPKTDAATLPEKKHKALKDQLIDLCGAFSALSDIFMNLSEHVRVPSIIEFRDICDKSFDEYCADCRNRELCWEREYGSSADMVAKLSAELHGCGRASAASVPEHIKERCPSLGALIENINRRASRALEDALKRERAEVVSCDYEAFSSVIADAIKQNEDEYMIDEKLSLELSLCFAKKKEEFPIESLSVHGERQKHVTLVGVGAEAIRCSRERLKSKIEEISGERISEPVLEISDGKMIISFDIEPKYRAQTAHSVVSAEGKECGDTVSMFDGTGNYFYSMISDGMGSGRTAALASGICSVFMERMLSCGMRADSALKMLSAVLRAKSIECSSSIDLAEFDLILGKVSFVKSGAAPSYVRRGGHLFRLASKTVPIGILRTLDAEEIKFDLSSGDVIIMLSDGVCEDFYDCAWLPSLLTDEWDDDLDAMAEKIVREASIRNKKRDDISVGIVKII